MEISRYEEISAHFPAKSPTDAPAAPSVHHPSLPMAVTQGQGRPLAPLTSKTTKPADRVSLSREDVLLLIELIRHLAIDIRAFRTAVGPQLFPDRAIHNVSSHRFERASIKQRTLEKMQEYYRAAYSTQTSPSEELQRMMDRVMDMGSTLGTVTESELLPLHIEEDGTTSR